MAKPKVDVAADLIQQWAEQLVQEELPGHYEVGRHRDFVKVSIAGVHQFKVSGTDDDWQPRIFQVHVSVTELQ